MTRQRTLGALIRDLRKAPGWSQAELAERVGTTQQQIAAWESDKVRPRSGSVIKLAQAFGIAAEDLLAEAHTAAEKAAERAEKSRDQLARRLQVFADQYEEFHGEYRQISEHVSWLVTNFEALAEAVGLALSKPPTARRDEDLIIRDDEGDSAPTAPRRR